MSLFQTATQNEEPPKETKPKCGRKVFSEAAVPPPGISKGSVSGTNPSSSDHQSQLLKPGQENYSFGLIRLFRNLLKHERLIDLHGSLVVDILHNLSSQSREEIESVGGFAQFMRLHPSFIVINNRYLGLKDSTRSSNPTISKPFSWENGKKKTEIKDFADSQKPLHLVNTKKPLALNPAAAEFFPRKNVINGGCSDTFLVHSFDLTEKYADSNDFPFTTDDIPKSTLIADTKKPVTLNPSAKEFIPKHGNEMKDADFNDAENQKSLPLTDTQKHLTLNPSAKEFFPSSLDNEKGCCNKLDIFDLPSCALTENGYSDEANNDFTSLGRRLSKLVDKLKPELSTKAFYHSLDEITLTNSAKSSELSSVESMCTDEEEELLTSNMVPQQSDTSDLPDDRSISPSSTSRGKKSNLTTRLACRFYSRGHRLALQALQLQLSKEKVC
ncbi:hypothetical protein Bpfe_016191 [Biomphalaria pfeifferi]|uniref:E3 ubiquitin-protein ligase TTC3 winged helix turn helix domain-containing protein n=1 Tax=Biomphalaria pfeifferi TaxID=112525 RepID=A0AAD8F8B8_BIOPF|nr:hypothetical protein Bpfe_016191 [Biomphalaria pfeifferi]